MRITFQAEIIDYIKQNKGAETAELQKRFGISYKDAKSIIAELRSKGELVYVGGVKYSYVGKTETPQEAFGPDFEHRRFEPFRSVNGGNGLNDDDEDDTGEPKIDFEDLDTLFHDDNEESDDEIDDFDAAFQEQAKKLKEAVHRVTEKKNAPVSADVMPAHTFWADENEFMETLLERMERLIKSDFKMGQQGAVKKAETYLEAVRDTHDIRMIQVYERLVYELKNISPHLYRKLKKQFCEE